MKNKLTYVLISTIFMGGFFSSCSKDQTTVKETYVIDDNYKNLDQQIAQFRTTMLDTRKTGTVMELNEAVWMMEAAFNYYHGFTGEDYLATKTDSTFIPINYSGFDEVPVSELAALYKQVNNAIVASYQGYPAENKKPFIYDLELQGTATGSQLLVMTTVGTVNTQKDIIIGTETPFGSTDYWYPGPLWEGYTLPGKCGVYVGEQVGISAATVELEKAARANLRGTVYAGTTYFVEVVSGGTVFYEEYYYAQNPYGDYLLWKGNAEDCLNPDIMNFYFNGLAYIVNDRKPTGKTLIDIDIKMYLIPNVKDGNFFHNIDDITYGIKMERTLPPVEPGL